MSTRKSVPSALEPYLKLPPEATLILLTSTLGCSTTWLTCRYIGSILGASPGDQSDGEGENAVVLVSWLRDEKFWRGEIRRATGQDISKLSSTGHFAFIDGLTALATSKPDTALAGIQQAITATIEQLQGDKTVTLILDQPDTLLATTATTSQALNHFMLHLRSKMHSTILTLSTDLPLVSASTSTQGTPTPLETETASFLVQQAHATRFLIGVRELETGAARDVSGVVRVTRGGGAGDWDGEEHIDGAKEMEALFLVSRDGGVKVFERGSAG